MKNEAQSELFTVSKELIDFLIHSKESVRKSAARSLLSVSENEDFLMISTSSDALKKRLVRNLVRNIYSEAPELSKLCLSVLTNISAAPAIYEELIRSKLVEMIIENVRNILTRSRDIDEDRLSLSLLSNMTRQKAGEKQFIEFFHYYSKDSVLTRSFISSLIEKYLEKTHIQDRNLFDPFIHVINILTNIASSSAGIILLMRCYEKPSDAVREFDKLCETLVNEFSSINPDRRVFMLQYIRNLSLDNKFVQGVLLPSSALKHLLCLIYPPEHSDLRRVTVKSIERGDLITEFPPEHSWYVAEKSDITRKNEETIDSFIRKNSCGFPGSISVKQLTFQIIVNIARESSGRESLRNLGVYEIFRVWHLLEKDENLRKSIESIIHLFVYNENELIEQNLSIC